MALQGLGCLVHEQRRACLPAAAVAAVALPKGSDLQYARELYLGLKEAADPFNCASELVMTITNGPLLLSVSLM